MRQQEVGWARGRPPGRCRLLGQQGVRCPGWPGCPRERGAGCPRWRGLGCTGAAGSRPAAPRLGRSAQPAATWAYRPASATAHPAADHGAPPRVSAAAGGVRAPAPSCPASPRPPLASPASSGTVTGRLRTSRVPWQQAPLASIPRSARLQRPRPRERTSSAGARLQTGEPRGVRHWLPRGREERGHGETGRGGQTRWRLRQSCRAGRWRSEMAARAPARPRSRLQTLRGLRRRA
mmetsp:Transcript_11789/g.27059  ORF Transcript_11789/g.27059 Transcript_11789/m.27059 type:complete len:235 (+) Transcript_11789:84-788(+)